MSGGSSQQRRKARRAEERLADQLADKLAERLEPKQTKEIHAIPSDRVPPKALLQKLSQFWTSTPVWGAIGVLLGAIVGHLSLQLSFIGVGVVLFIDALRVGFFQSRLSRILGNAAVGFGIAIALFGIWKLTPKPKELATLDQQLDAFAKKFPWLTAKPTPSVSQPSPTLFEPIIHLEPDEGIVWSTGRKQTQGVFTVTLSNTGLEDIDTVNIVQDYFVAERSHGEIILKRLGQTPVQIPRLKGKTGKAPLVIDFRPYTDTAREVMTNFNGPSMIGVKILVSFRRHSDGKDFSSTFGYGALNPNAPAIYARKSQPDSEAAPGVLLILSDGHGYFTDSVNAGVSTIALNPGRIALSDVFPYFNLEHHWVPVVKEVTVQDGKQIIRQY